MVLEEGVLEGRRTFANMLKYINMTASSNYGNGFSVLMVSAFIPFLPMLPMHLLLQNLLCDISQIAIHFYNVDEQLLKKPQRWYSRDVGRFMVFFGSISSIFDITTCHDMVRSQRQHTAGADPVPVWLVCCRFADEDLDSAHDPHAEDSVRPEPGRLAVACNDGGGHDHRNLPADGAPGVLLQVQELPPLYFLCLPLLLLAYMGLTQAMKGVYFRRYGWQ